MPPSDRDKDGVYDAQDLCPDVAGGANTRGCPDRDSDGFADKDDACPDVAGTVVLKGCPDRDADGVADASDKCPDVPGSPLPQYMGCPIPDTDKDGVRDDIDKCPTVPGTFADAGCPPEKPGIEKLQPVLDVSAKSIQFKTGSAVLTVASYGALDAIVETLGQNADLQLIIEGHTDNAGSASVNKALSLKRANTVKTYLTKKGVAASRMTAEGFGSGQPVDNNKTAAGRAKNRRVILKLQ